MPKRKHRNNGERAAPQKTNPIAGAIFSFVLLAIGAAVFLFGKRAIVAEYYEYPSRRALSIGSLGFYDKEGFRILEGPEAIYWGIAFCALGVMFGLWGCGIAFASLAGKNASTEPSAFGRANTWLSFIVLLVAILCLFPPWRLGSAVFYIASVLAVGSIVYKGEGLLKDLPAKVLGGLVLLAIIAGNINLPTITASIIIALVAMLFVGIHVLILAPDLMKRKSGEKVREISSDE